MTRNKTGVMPEITRETYKAVKKFDRQQFGGFCKDLYTFGYEDGKASLDMDKLYAAIAATKGIGAKKLEEIKANIKAALVGEDKKSEDKNAEKE